MKNEDLINFLREIIYCYDFVNDPAESPSRKEVTMWRKRFLQSLDSSTLSAYIKEVFLSCPSDEFIKRSPEQNIEENSKYET